MSRYIDADAFLKEYCEPYPHVYMAMSKAMAEAPSIDIVRCGECRWGAGKQIGEAVYCEWHGFPWNVNGFCSYGERREP